jgi:hypothetical protein
MVRLDLQDLQLTGMTELGRELRDCSRGATSMEQYGQRIVRSLRDGLLQRESGAPACALVRFYRTLRFAELDDELKEFATRGAQNQTLTSDVRCLTLLGTVGDEPEWNSRRSSRHHRTIPLPSEESVARIPMVAQLLTQLGLEVADVVRADASPVLEREQHTYNVFYVAEAKGSAYIPAQSEFVVPYAIRSVVGFGGVLPTGDVFAVLLFSKVPIARDTADLFRNAALNVKVGLLPFVDGSGSTFATT